jgi:hypothetical protein
LCRLLDSRHLRFRGAGASLVFDVAPLMLLCLLTHLHVHFHDHYAHFDYHYAHFHDHMCTFIIIMCRLMDSSDMAVQELLGFSCVRPLRTVAAFLEERGRLELLDDPLMEVRVFETWCSAVTCANPQVSWRAMVCAVEQGRLELLDNVLVEVTRCGAHCCRGYAVWCTLL